MGLDDSCIAAEIERGQARAHFVRAIAYDHTVFQRFTNASTLGQHSCIILGLAKNVLGT